MMKVFLHHMYEFRKGLRNLVLYTGCCEDREAIEERLKRRCIAYLIQEVMPSKINVYFGHSACVDVVRNFVHKPLQLLTPEEDFMLGTLLGYGLYDVYSVGCYV